MKFKKLVSIVLVAAMAVSMVACGNSSNSAPAASSSEPAKQEAAAPAPEAAKPVKATVLNMDMSVPITSSWGVAAETFAKEISEKTEGRYEIKIFTNSELAGGNQAKDLEMLQSGDIDIGIFGTLTMASGDVRIAMSAMPWLFDGFDDAYQAMKGEGGDLVKDVVRGVGVEPLAFGISGFRQLFNNLHPIKTPDDIAGVKIRVPGNSMYVDLFKTLGADPVTMNSSELYTALSQGAVDGQENPADMTITQKFCEVLKYMTPWSYSCEHIILSTSQNVWDSLSDEDKAIFQEAADIAMEAQVKAARERNDDYMKQLVDEYKIEVYELSDEELQAFKDKAAPIYDAYRETMGEDLYKAFGLE